MNSKALEQIHGEQPNQAIVLDSLLHLPPSLLGPAKDIRERFDRLTKYILTPEDRENVDEKMNTELIAKIQMTLAEYQLRVTSLEHEHIGFIGNTLASTAPVEMPQAA